MFSQIFKIFWPKTALQRRKCNNIQKMRTTVGKVCELMQMKYIFNLQKKRRGTKTKYYFFIDNPL